MSLYRVVTYVLRDAPKFGLMPGFVIMGVRKPTPAETRDWVTHYVLKTWPEFYRAMQSGEKTFEIRRDDREPPYAVGARLELVYFDPSTPRPEGEPRG